MRCGRRGRLVAGRLGLVISSRAGRHGSYVAVEMSDLTIPAEEEESQVMRGSYMYGRRLGFLFLLWSGLYAFALPAHSQSAQEEPLPGPDSQQQDLAPHGRLFAYWGGERPDLQQRGRNCDFHTAAASL